MTDIKTTTRDIFAWLNQVLADRRLPPIAFKLAFALAQHVNKETGIAWPSRERLASLIGINSRGVNRVTKLLVTAGHLTVDMRGGRHQTNHYRLAKTVSPETPFNDGNGVAGDTPQFRNCVTERPKGCYGATKRVSPATPWNQRERIDPPEIFKVLEARLERAVRRALKGAVSLPKKQGVMTAQAAFLTSLQFASAGEIIAGAERYATSRAGEEYRYHKDPTQWLQGRHWMDAVPPKKEPAPRSSGGRGKPGYLNLAAQHIYDAEGHGE